jgi:predicted GIY-YIG superfamily endonuclease/plasmid replication initiation protein
MYYVYQFYDKKNKLIYVGKTTNLSQRFIAHFNDGGWKSKEIERIMYAKCSTKTDMDMYEIYYINKLKPKYNISLVNGDNPSFILPELTFIEFKDNALNEKYKNKQISITYDCNLLLVEQRLIHMSIEYINENKINYNDRVDNNFCLLIKIPIIQYRHKFNIKANNIYSIMNEVVDNFAFKYYKSDNMYKKFVSYAVCNNQKEILLYYNLDAIKFIMENIQQYLLLDNNIKGSYTMQLYNIIKNTNNKPIQYNVLKQLMVCENKYSAYNDFKRFVLNQSIKDINEFSDIRVDIKEICTNRRNRKVDKLVFEYECI